MVQAIDKFDWDGSWSHPRSIEMSAKRETLSYAKISLTLAPSIETVGADEFKVDTV
jgi:hypothetical protein